MNFQALSSAEKIVEIMNRIYYGGMTTASGGNLSIRDADGTVWITPGGADKGALRPEDIVKVAPGGEVVGNFAPAAELPVHLEIYNRRPEVGAVLHAYPPALVTFSVLRQLPRLAAYPFVKYKCGNLAAIPCASMDLLALADAIGEQFERGSDIAILENHGVMTAAKDLHTAFALLEALNLCAKIEIKAMSVGHTPISLSPKHMAVYMLNVASPMPEFVDYTPTEAELRARRELCGLVRRAYQRRMFTGEQGTYSMRVVGDTFLITPCDKDRAYLEPEDLVLIRGSQRQEGKNPSRSADLHMRIYKNKPEVNSIIIAQPPNIMAYTVTDAEFDSRLVTEVFLNLGVVRKIPFGASIMQPELFAREVTLERPACIVENDCVIVCSASTFGAFEALEVLEFGAQTLLGAAQLGGSCQNHKNAGHER